jgi:hypothetical protein
VPLVINCGITSTVMSDYSVVVAETTFGCDSLSTRAVTGPTSLNEVSKIDV